MKLPEKIKIFRKFSQKIEIFLHGSTTPQISNQIDAAGLKWPYLCPDGLTSSRRRQVERRRWRLAARWVTHFTGAAGPTFPYYPILWSSSLRGRRGRSLGLGGGGGRRHEGHASLPFAHVRHLLEVSVEASVYLVLADVGCDHHEDGAAVDENDGDDVVEGTDVVLLMYGAMALLEDGYDKRPVLVLFELKGKHPSSSSDRQVG